MSKLTEEGFSPSRNAGETGAAAPKSAAPKSFAAGFAVAYLLSGAFLGFGMAHNIPAMSLAGVAYYALTWPQFIASGAYGIGTPYIPPWAYSFGPERGQ